MFSIGKGGRLFGVSTISGACVLCVRVRHLMGKLGAERPDAGGRRTSRRRLPADGAQMGGALQGRGRRGAQGSLLAAASAHGRRRHAVVDQVEALRRQRWTGKQIAAEIGVSPATVSRILKRLGLNRIAALEPAEPVRRYEREHPGELIHIDIKKLGRFERVGHRITGDRTGQSNSPAASAGSSSMSASTTPPASPSRRSCPTRRRRAPSPSSRPPSPTTPASASPSPAS